MASARQTATTLLWDAEVESEDPAPGAISVVPAGLDRDRPWVRGALCMGADPELFFPEGAGEPALRSIARAKAVCAACPVRADCLEWALGVGEADGIWGGTTPHERRILRRTR